MSSRPTNRSSASSAGPASTTPGELSLTLSANAAPGRGGQGLNLLHWLHALGPHFRLGLFARQGCEGFPATVATESGIGRLLPKIPWVRRFRGLQVAIEERHFDRFVAAHLERCDVFQGATGQCLQSLRRARQLGARTALDVVTLHADLFSGELEQECREFGIDSPISGGSRRRMVAEYAEADVIRVMSHVARRTFLDRGVASDKVVVATPPIDVPPEPLAHFREPVFRICFVAGIEPWKGFHHLIQAFEKLNLADSELEMWGWPGTGKVRQFIEAAQRRNPRIRLRKEIVRSAGFAEVYGRASVFVLPSLADGFGYVVAEAMASGLPVIVSTRTGAADLITEGVNGFVVNPRDVDALAERLQFLARHPERLSQLGLAARETISHLSLDTFSRDWIPALRGGQPTQPPATQP